jgi:hypothetical protein
MEGGVESASSSIPKQVNALNLDSSNVQLARIVMKKENHLDSLVQNITQPQLPSLLQLAFQ